MAAKRAASRAPAEVVETEAGTSRWPLQRMWSWLWPKVAAVALMLVIWQAVGWAGWKPDYVLPGPGLVFRRLAQDLGSTNFDLGIAITLRRAFIGYATAVTIGSL